MQERASDPYQILLKSNKLPMSLIRDGKGKNGLKQHQAKIEVESAPFGDTFGPKAQRKRVKLGVGSLEDLAGESTKMHVTYLERLEQAKLLSGTSGSEEQAGEAAPEDAVLSTAKEPIFSKGQSKRIWNELYKVIDSSDVVIHVLDARDPWGTRCRSVEKYIREEAPHKHLIFVLNKCDLVPTGVAVSSCIPSVVAKELSLFPLRRTTFPIVKSRGFPALCALSPWTVTLLRVGYINSLSAASDLWVLRRLLAVLGSWSTGSGNVAFELKTFAATQWWTNGGFLSNASYIHSRKDIMQGS